SASVSWTAPASDGGSVITGYKVIPYNVTTSTGAATVASTSGATITGLTSGDDYTFRVVATNAVGDSAASDPSTAILVATVPGAPTGVVGTKVSTTSASVSWTAPASDGGSVITGYKVIPYNVTTSTGAATVASTSGATITGLTSGDDYTFRVVATNAVGDSAASDPSTAILVATVPGAPTGVVGTKVSTTSASVSWTAPASDGGSVITGYKVIPYNVTTSTGAATVASTSGATITGLTSGDDYTFRVVATNAVGDSAASDPSTAILVATVPGAPTGVVGTKVSTTSASVSWTAPASDGGSAITVYKVIPYNVTTNTDESTVASTSGATITGLTSWNQYTFRVVATNAVGDSTASVASTAITLVATVPD